MFIICFDPLIGPVTSKWHQTKHSDSYISYIIEGLRKVPHYDTCQDDPGNKLEYRNSIKVGQILQN